MSNLRRYIVNNQSVWRGRLSKINGVHHNDGQSFTIRPLNKNDAKEMEKLSLTIYDHLNEGEECFIHRHNEEYYNNIFENKNIHYIGVFRGDKLIGMSYIHLCYDKKSFTAEIPNSPIDFFENNRTSMVAAMGADCVHPAYRGNKLNQIMIQCRLELAAELGCSDAFSIIDRKNHWNMAPYFNNGFNMFASAIDPSDNGKIALMHRDLQNNQQYEGSGISVPYNRLDLIDNLMAQGYVGRGYNPESGNIKFMPIKRNEYENNNTKNQFVFVTQMVKGNCCV